ncbi:hypothetical protein H6F67_20870 [Microcoleus sp. FACHB-1515]|uniref:hypothetical protein n=1 Tax=Cyanophyceae TaxID=3028117 RepID=UPI001687FCA8|nr:hypothetical protein [Microcoleus sp. FACHB-1515]MBD2092305.1 hypothetical protein [Microcoleus sp. FACHB-1515]
MFQLNDYAQHQASGRIGKVIGFGHQMLDSVYLPTLKVRITEGNALGSFLEDVSSAWVPVKV